MAHKGWKCANCGRVNYQTLRICPCGSSHDVGGELDGRPSTGDDLLLQRLEALRDKFSKPPVK